MRYNLVFFADTNSVNCKIMVGTGKGSTDTGSLLRYFSFAFKTPKAAALKSSIVFSRHWVSVG